MSLLLSLGIVVALVLLGWVAGEALGFEVSLGFSLLASVALTLLLHLVLRAVFRRRG